MLKEIPVGQIRPNTVALRAVDKQREGYEELVESIRDKGVINPISVRPKTDKESGKEFFELIDGLHRYTASIDANCETIPAQVLELDDAGVLDAQIIANIHKVETKPSEYSKQLRRILTMNPMMTERELATKLCKSTAWIKQRLSLNRIKNEQIEKLIDDGKIVLSNAYALAKLPDDEVGNWIDRAITDTPDQFVTKVNKRVKELNDAKRQGKDAPEAEFQPVAHSQKVGVLKDELEKQEVGPALVKQYNITDPVSAFNLAVQWMLHLDPASVEKQKAEWEAKKRERDEAKARKEAKKKADAAAKKEKEAKEAQKEAAEAAAAVTE